MMITNEMINEIRKITVEKRNDAIDKVAEIIKANVTDRFRYSKTSKGITFENKKIELTTKKNKTSGLIEVKELDIFTMDGSKVINWETIKIQ